MTKTIAIRRALAVFACCSCLFLTHAGDWTQWRGAARDGRAAETGLLQTWPENGPELTQKIAGLGSGYSSVAVVGDRVYTLGDLADGQHAMAIDTASGKILWKTLVGPIHEDKYIGSRSTPTVVDDRLYLVTTESDVFCLGTTDGSIQWKRNLVKEFGGSLMKAMGQYDWKYAESPLVDNGRVIVTPGGSDALVVALNAKTGEELWRTPAGTFGERGADGAGYSSAVISEAGGVRQYVQLVGRGVIGIEADSGKALWRYNRVANDIANIPTPIIDGDHVFASTGYGTGSALLKIGENEGAWSADEVYFLEADTLQNHHGGLILDGGTIFTGTGHNKGFPIAVDLKSGDVKWGPARNEGSRSAAIAFADGRLYLRYENGLMVLVEATADAYREHGSFMIPDVRQFSWSHPVIANGKLYLREQDNLFIYDIRKKPTASAATLKDQVWQTEVAFAKTMSDRDHDAFASFLADEAIFFVNQRILRGSDAVQAAWKPLYEGPDAPFSWKPELVEVLDSGDLAHSSGPVIDASGTVIGSFNSIWRRESTDTWKVVFDKGCNAPQSPVVENEAGDK
ncbi:MAG: PQQ-binding-like beta-propeller repeat protein [Acidobacteriota bacterium]|nr:PQQ-binding-like beta-propeller repeat protein [Acidobacteriota bacterium]MDH3785195.1 PQQ-binding-like beta-propeller repeat protein [Acidobacteriota bacterium]